MKNRASIGFLVSALSINSWACLPPSRIVVPPTKHDGEFTYIYPDKDAQAEKYARSKNLAVVKTISAFRLKEPKFERYIIELEILHGWGYQSGRYIKTYNPFAPCDLGEFTPETWNVVIFNDFTKKVEFVIPYDKLKPYLLLRGKPEYVYTPMGLML